MLTRGTGILPDEFWKETICEKCGDTIPLGEPRRICAFLSLAYGPGSQEYECAQRINNEIGDGDEDIGLEHLRAITFCIPCSGEDSDIPNPWNVEREERATDDPGGSVRVIPVSQMQFRADEEVVAEYSESRTGPAYQVRQSVSVEEQDAVLSGFAPLAKNRVASARRTRSQMSENDYRARMARFIRANPSAMHGRMLQVCTMWAQGKKQLEIEREVGIDQSTVCRLVRSGKAMLG